jgi:hypothetical protein
MLGEYHIGNDFEEFDDRSLTQVLYRNYPGRETEENSEQPPQNILFIDNDLEN